MAGYNQPTMVPGPIEYKRKYTLWVLVLLIIVCWPAAILYYFTRDKVPVQEFQTYATPQAYQAAPAMAPPPPAPGGAPVCPRCGKLATFVPQYNRYYCYTDQAYV